MNLAVAVDYLYPDMMGGAYTYAHDVAQRLAARGHRCFGISAHPGDGRPMREKIGGIEYYRYPLRRGSHILSFASLFAGSMRAARAIAKEHGIDVLHTHEPMSSVGACIAARSSGWRRGAPAPPQLATMHGTSSLSEYLCEVRSERDRGRDLPYRIAIDTLERWYLRQARRLTALSRYSCDAYARHHGLDPTRVAILPPGVDLERFRPGQRDEARRRLGLPLERPIVLSVRRLTRRMGLDLLIRAARLVADQMPQLLLLIGGKGPLRSQLEALIADLNLEENARLVGLVSPEELPLYYQAADLFALPSVASEGFGIVTVEALACDLPVLATAGGGSVDILQPLDPEMLFADTTPEAMAERIVAWLKKPRERSYHAQIVERYNWDRCLDGFEAVLAGLGNGR